MAAMSTAWSPNSFQMRLALDCRRSPAVLLRMRIGKLDRQFRAFSFAADSSRNGSGIERLPTGNRWMNSISSADSFSGWSEADSGEESADSGRKRRLGGIIGAGVAGVVLVAGLTLASLSMGKRKTSTQEMEPLTTQQEVLLTSDEQNDGVEGDEDKSIKNADFCFSKTGIENNSSSFTENNEANNESKGSSDVGYTVDSGDVTNKATSQEDLQSAIDDESVTSPDTSRLPKSEIGHGLSMVSVYQNLESSLVDEKSESAIEPKENLSGAKPTSDVNQTDLNTDHLEEGPGSSGTETSNLSFDSSSVSTVHIPPESEPLPVSVPVNTPQDTSLEPNIVYKEPVETIELSSNREDIDPSEAKVSVEESKSSSEEHNVTGEQSTGTTPVSAVAYPFTNEQDENTNDIINESTFFPSTNPGASFSSAGIPAPSVVSAALQVAPGKVLVPAVVDQVQGQALAALQVLKVIEAEVQPGDLCTRREYARWLVSASSTLSRNTTSKVYPAMYIENVTELAFDDITPEDPDFPSIQGLAEAGLISSKLSRHDMPYLQEDHLYFSPESPLSRQDLVTWKMALEKRQLPVADRKKLHQHSGFIDIDKINPDACPALVADLSAGENGVVALAFGYTRLFQPDKPVTKAQAAIALATGEASDIVSEELARIEAESMAENAVAAHNALVAEVEKDVNANFEKELLLEREKIGAMEKLAEEARLELERLKAVREEDNIALMKERAAVESEMEVLSRFRHEVEEQLESLMSEKVQISYEKDRLNKLVKEAETENSEIARLQHELEIERKALSMARAWAEDEAKRAREQAKVLEEARDRWERHGIKVVVDSDLQEEADVGVTWLNAGNQLSVEGTVNRAENLVDKLKAMSADVRERAKDTISKIIEKILNLIAALKKSASKLVQRGGELKDDVLSKMGSSLQELQQNSAGFTLAVKEGVKRVAGDCKVGVEKLSQKFKT
ncbi:hypothetical protein NMG60_11022290 [Bertholletia excelsa]